MNSMAGEQPQAPSSPTDSDDVEITIGCPKVFWVDVAKTLKSS
jgi:hypothetical protein